MCSKVTHTGLSAHQQHSRCTCRTIEVEISKQDRRETGGFAFRFVTGAVVQATTGSACLVLDQVALLRVARLLGDPVTNYGQRFGRDRLLDCCVLARQACGARLK